MQLNLAGTFREAGKIYASVLNDAVIGTPVRLEKDNTRITNTLSKEFEQTALRVQNKLLQYAKQATFLLPTELNQGDYIEFYPMGTVITESSVPNEEGIIFSTITTDPVSKICSILCFNVRVTVTTKFDAFDKHGNMTVRSPVIQSNVPVYLERSTYTKKAYGVGVAREIIAVLYAYKNEDIKVYDIIEFESDKYRVDDIDEIEQNHIIIASLSNYME